MAVLPSAICTARAPSGRPANLSLVSRGLRDAIEQHFGANSPQRGVREIAFVERVGLVRLRAELVGARRADIAHQPLEVVFVFGEVLAKRVEQRPRSRADC